MDDSQGGPVEGLIEDVVGIAVAAFVLQGLWFGFTATLTATRPELGEPLGRTSAMLGPAWLGLIAVGFGWAVKRARRGPPGSPGRR